jgi:hypothetical protein
MDTENLESSLCPIQMSRSRKHTKIAGRRRRTVKRGGGYGFGGSILSNPGSPNAGSALWNNQAGSDCGANLQGRGGNNMTGGRRRRGKGKGKTAGRRRHRGGNLALQQPRTGYTFNGSGVAGTADTVPVGSPVTVV